MTDLLLVGGALRNYGTWGEQDYRYGVPTPAGLIAAKRFTWSEKVRCRHAPALEFALSYFSDAFVDPKRMNDLAYLAGQERKALEVLAAMVQEAVNGTGYIGLPSPQREVMKDLVQLIGEWVRQDGYPEDWQAAMERVVEQAFARLRLWKERLQAAQATLNPEHQDWGLAFPILPPEPREETATT